MDSVTTHGLPRIFTSRRMPLKIFWAVIFTMSCSVLVLFLFERVQLFQLRKNTIKVERTTNSIVELPTLTICDTDLNSDEQDRNFTKFPNSCKNQSGNHTTKLFRYGCKLFMSNLGYSCSYNFSSRCQFPKYFTPSPNFYRCFTFNKGGIITQTLNERAYGIDLLLFKNSTDPYTKTTVGLDPLKRFSQGLMLHLHHADITMGASKENVIPLIPGHEVEISVKKIVLKRLPAPFSSNCSNTSTERQLIGDTYTRKNCLTSCFFSRIYDSCGRVTDQAEAFMPKNKFPDTSKFVNTAAYERCKFGVLETGITYCDCPTPCEETVYKAQIMQKPWALSAVTKRARVALGKYFGIPSSDITLDFFKENLIHLSVFYEDFTTESFIEQELYSIESLLCDLGGLMGLLIGASIISIVEILWVFSEKLFNRLFKSNRQVTAKEPEELS